MRKGLRTVGERLACIKIQGLFKKDPFWRQQARPCRRGRESLGGFRGETMVELAFHPQSQTLSCDGIWTWNSGTFQQERGCSKFWSGHGARDMEVFRGLNSCQVHRRDGELHLGSCLGFPGV